MRTSAARLQIHQHVICNDISLNNPQGWIDSLRLFNICTKRYELVYEQTARKLDSRHII